MALNQHLEDDMPRISSFEGIPSLEMRQSSDAATVDSGRDASGGFDCNICLECVQEPVVTLCGHLFCWPCIYKWIHFQSTSSENKELQKLQCPVCKSEVSQSSLVPLYGRGQSAMPSEGKARQVGIAVPRRPLGPRSHNATAISQSSSQSYHPYDLPQQFNLRPTGYDDPQQFNFRPTSYDAPQQFNSSPSSNASPVLGTNGSVDPTFGVYGGMIYARVFGNQITNTYTYPNSYNLSGNGNPRIRRRLMEADESLGRICFFLLCCVVMCFLLF